MATRLTYRALPGTRMGTRQAGILFSFDDLS